MGPLGSVLDPNLRNQGAAQAASERFRSPLSAQRRFRPGTNGLWSMHSARCGAAPRRVWRRAFFCRGGRQASPPPARTAQRASKTPNSVIGRRATTDTAALRAWEEPRARAAAASLQARSPPADDSGDCHVATLSIVDMPRLPGLSADSDSIPDWPDSADTPQPASTRSLRLADGKWDKESAESVDGASPNKSGSATQRHSPRDELRHPCASRLRSHTWWPANLRRSLPARSAMATQIT